MSFIDIDQTFKLNAENEIDKLYDADSIKQSLKNILLVKQNSYIKYRKPHYGSQLSNLLFKKMNNVVIDQIKTEIELCIENYESRVKLKSIDTDLDGNNLLITINYFIINFNSEDTLEVKFAVL